MRLTLLFTILASPVWAQDEGPAMRCQGSGPDWSLSATPQGATFTLITASDMSLQLTTLVQGVDWPRAYTFIGRGDSAIVIVEGAGDDGLHPTRILTQLGETPLLMTGFCDLG